MKEFGQKLLAFLNNSRKTSETKALMLGVLWVLMAKVFPAYVPLTLPAFDSPELGTLTLSPAFCFTYMFIQAGRKIFKDGSTPFVPDPPPAQKEGQ